MQAGIIGPADPAAAPSGAPLILFGAFDRHNFGDLLFPHIAAAMMPEETPLVAGLLPRDLRADGGHAVQSIPALVRRFKDEPIRVLHAGGETLTCSAWEAAVMLQVPDCTDAAAPTDGSAGMSGATEDIGRQAEWASRFLGTRRRAPYVLDRDTFGNTARLAHCGIGGAALDSLPETMRTEVFAALRHADHLAVRYCRTQALLRDAGLASELVPDPAVLVRDLFGERIRCAGGQGEAAHIARLFDQRYLAVQCSADFSDDRTLDLLAGQLDELSQVMDAGIVLFRAGAAPWHDDLDVYQRLAARLRRCGAVIFPSLDIWQICALIAQSLGFCGSSLHGRIVATAFGLPRLTIGLPHASPCWTKHAEYLATWEQEDMPDVVQVDHVAEAMARACAIPGHRMLQHADSLSDGMRNGFRRLHNRLK